MADVKEDGVAWAIVNDQNVDSPFLVKRQSLGLILNSSFPIQGLDEVHTASYNGSAIFQRWQIFLFGSDN